MDEAYEDQGGNWELLRPIMAYLAEKTNIFVNYPYGPKGTIRPKYGYKGIRSCKGIINVIRKHNHMNKFIGKYV